MALTRARAGRGRRAALPPDRRRPSSRRCAATRDPVTARRRCRRHAAPHRRASIRAPARVRFAAPPAAGMSISNSSRNTCMLREAAQRTRGAAPATSQRRSAALGEAGALEPERGRRALGDALALLRAVQGLPEAAVRRAARSRKLAAPRSARRSRAAPARLTSPGSTRIWTAACGAVREWYDRLIAEPAQRPQSSASDNHEEEAWRR